jgi:hypothetical protein
LVYDITRRQNKSVEWNVKWCPVSWHAKDRFQDVRKMVGLWRQSGKPKLSKTKHCIIFNRRNMAEILLKRRKTQIKQSIKTGRQSQYGNDGKS